MKVPETSGVYKIHCDFRFPRLHKTTDILYIGRGANLKERLLTFPHGFNAMKAGNEYSKRKAIKRFWRINTKHELLFSYQQTSHAKEQEKREIKKFEHKHLELPPLNHAN